PRRRLVRRSPQPLDRRDEPSAPCPLPRSSLDLASIWGRLPSLACSGHGASLRLRIRGPRCGRVKTRRGGRRHACEAHGMALSRDEALLLAFRAELDEETPSTVPPQTTTQENKEER